MIADLDVTYATTGGQNEAADAEAAISQAVMDEVQDMRLGEHPADPTYVRVVGRDFYFIEIQDLLNT